MQETEGSTRSGRSALICMSQRLVRKGTRAAIIDLTQVGISLVFTLCCILFSGTCLGQDSYSLFYVNSQLSLQLEVHCCVS